MLIVNFQLKFLDISYHLIYWLIMLIVNFQLKSLDNKSSFDLLVNYVNRKFSA